MAMVNEFILTLLVQLYSVQSLFIYMVIDRSWIHFVIF